MAGARGVGHACVAHRACGRADAAGPFDFNGEGYGDLAIGVPGEDSSGLRDAGRVVVLRGSARGLGRAGAQRWDEAAAGIPGDPGAGDRFGSVLSVGDVDADGYADLAIATGVSRDASSLRRGINVLRGTPTGLSTVASQFLFDAPELTRDCVEDDCGVPFGGMVLADFNGDGSADLGHAVIPGRVVVRFSRGGTFGTGPTSAIDVETPGADRSWSIGPDDGLRQEGGPRDLVGLALAAGDLTGDGLRDLAIGAPGWDGDGVGFGVGIVYVVPGSRTVMPPSVGARAIGDSAGDLLGAALTVLPLGGTAPGGSLAIGAPGDSAAGRAGAGRVTLCPGDANLYEGGCATWSQATRGVRGTAERGDGFGTAIGS
jgi:hypothetical protein